MGVLSSRNEPTRALLLTVAICQVSFFLTFSFSHHSHLPDKLFILFFISLSLSRSPHSPLSAHSGNLSGSYSPHNSTFSPHSPIFEFISSPCKPFSTRFPTLQSTGKIRFSRDFKSGASCLLFHILLDKFNKTSFGFHEINSCLRFTFSRFFKSSQSSFLNVFPISDELLTRRWQFSLATWTRWLLF